MDVRPDASAPSPAGGEPTGSIRVSHLVPSASLPTTVAGTTAHAAALSSKGRAAKATAPVPG